MMKPLGKKYKVQEQEAKARTFIKAAQTLCEHTPNDNNRVQHKTYLTASHKLLLLQVGRVTDPELRDLLHNQAKICEAVLQGIQYAENQKRDKSLLEVV
jgi:hypothetical protein